MTIKLKRQERVLKDLTKIFKTNPNGIFPLRSIKQVIKNYDTCSIYNGLSILVKTHVINIAIISRKKYYWLRRREAGDK